MISERAFWKRKAVRHFVEEIRLLSKLRHPSITTVMGAVISSTSEPMLVMEHMHFGSLHDFGGRGSKPPEKVHKPAQGRMGRRAQQAQ